MATVFNERFRDQLEVGDVLLSACRDRLSWVIRTGSRSPFSHVVLVTGPGQLTEAYDHAMTPDESEEGIFELPLDDYLKRPLQRVQVRRPVGVDKARISEVAEHLRGHSPGFPTIGMAVLALCGLSGPLLRRLPAPIEHRWTMRQIRWAADGLARMHCAETVTRIFLAAGLDIGFDDPRLAHHIDHLLEVQQPWLDGELPTTPRVATRGAWPEGRGVSGALASTRYGVTSAARTIKGRVTATGPFDAADLILPGDFARAEPFVLAGDYIRTAEGWYAATDVTPRPQPVEHPLAA